MLTKLPKTTYTPGQPYIAPTPAYTFCIPAPPSGRWEYSCLTIDAKTFSEGSYPVPPWQLVKDPGEEPVFRLCAATWVPDPKPVSPPVCTNYPANPGQPHIPSTTVTTPIYGWEAGAVSITEVPDDAEMSLTGMGLVVGVVVGFTADREDEQTPEMMSHAFYFHTNQAGERFFRVMEYGVPMTADSSYDETTDFRIRRLGDVVVYLVDGEKIYYSTLPSYGTLSVGSAFYASGDVIP